MNAGTLIFFTFVASHKKNIHMDAVVIEARTKSDVRFLMDFSKRIGAKVIDTDEWIESVVMSDLIEKGLREPDVSEEEVMEALRQ